jgi:hypothetical protein
MLLLHDQMPLEAAAAAEAIRRAFGFPVCVREAGITEILPSIPAFRGRLAEPLMLLKLPGVTRPGCVGLIRADLFMNDKSIDDDWAFGAEQGGCVLASGARMGSDLLRARRLAAIVVHEICHAVVPESGAHLKPAKWVNVANGYELPLGPHCTDQRCAMYEVADLIAPPPDEGHILLGNEVRRDTGLDELLDRIHETWLCDRCRESIKAADYWTK